MSARGGFFVRCGQSYNAAGAGSAHGCAWSNGTRRNTSRAHGIRDMVNQFDHLAERLRAVIVENRPFTHTIPLYDRDDAVFYVDPPYLGTTRSSLDAAGRRKSDYANDFTTEDDHLALAEVLHQVQGAVLLSGYHSELYDELYADWHTVEVDVQRPSSNRKGHTAAAATEVIWCSRPPSGQGTIFDHAEAAA